MEVVLQQLAAAAHVVQLERQPGQKEARWQQRVAEEPEVTWSAAPVNADAVRGSMADRVAQLEAKVARLEAALADLLPPESSDLPLPPPAETPHPV